MSLCLTADELIELTGKQRSGAQARVLRAMGVEHRVRPDRSVAVSKAHVEHLLNPGGGARVRKEKEPNWAAIE